MTSVATGALIVRTPSQFWSELLQRSPLLAYLSVGFVALSLVLLGLWAADPAPPILGLNRWVKPLKFATSIAIFLATAGWLLGEVRASRAVDAIAWTVAVAMVLEMLWLLYQAGHGRRSHFNLETPRDSLLLGMAGFVIAVNTVAMAGVLALLYLQPRADLPVGWLAALRLGLWLFLIGSLVGGLMISRMSHSVGGMDGGPGLPLLNWSRTHGDLRVAHFVGLHALQLVPLVAAYAWQQGWDVLFWARTTAGLVAALLVWVWGQALLGLPVWR